MDSLIFDKRNRRFGMMFIFALLLSSIEYINGQVSLYGCANPVVYSSCDLTCQTPDQSADAVKFFKPPNLSSVIAQCAIDGSCAAVGGYSIQRSTSTTTVLTILNYTCTDSVTWRCDYDSKFAIYDAPCVDFPQTATTTDMSDNSVVNSSVVITVNLGCLISEGTIQMKFDYKNSGGTIVDSSALSTCSNVSTCADPLYSTYECQVNLRKESNVLCETKYSIDANVKIADADRTESIHLLNDVEFTCSSDGGKSGDDFWWIIVIVVVVLLIIILIILFCCFFNKRCRFRYVCADSKCAFTLPKRAIYIIRDENKCTKRLEGEEIEIQFLNRGKGKVRHDLNISTEVGKTERNPCILFNPYILNKYFKKEHEGIYTYESKLNENRNCYGLTLLFQEDTIITDTSFVYWAHVGERLRLQHKDDYFSVHITKKNDKNENVTRIKSTSRRKGLVLNNICNKDTGSYQVISTDKAKKSGCLTLNIVNDHIRIGNRSESYVATVGSSMKLQSMQCETLNIKSVTWKKSLHSTGRDSVNVDARDNKSCTSKYALVLINVTKQHKGFYFCEIIYKDNQQKTETSAILKLDVVDEIVSVEMTPRTYTAMEDDSIEIRHNGATFYEYIKFPARECESNRVKALSKQIVSPFIFDKISKSDEGEYRFQRSKDQATKSVLTLFVTDVVKVGEEPVFHVCLKNRSIKLQYTGCLGHNIEHGEWRKDQQAIKDANYNSKRELILKNLKEHEQGEYVFKVTYIDGYEKSKSSGTVTLTIVDAIFNMDMKSISCSAMSGDSIQIRCTSETVPHHIVFTVAVSGTNQVAPTPKKIEGSSLLIEKISKEHEGCYHFESDDDKAKSGFLTLSVKEVTKSSSAVHLGTKKPTSFRPGAKKTLNSIAVMSDIKDGHTYKKEREIDEDPDNKESKITEETDKREPNIVQENDKKEKKSKKKKKNKKKEKGSDANAND